MRCDEIFKAIHRRLAPPDYYALDADLILVAKIPPNIVYPVAHLEFKMGKEPLSFTQAVYFNHLVSIPLPWRVPVYIIRAHEPYALPEPQTTMRRLSREYCQLAYRTHRFSVAQYLHGDWRPEPPHIMVALIAEDIGWSELIEWERELRRARREELAPYLANGWTTSQPLPTEPNSSMQLCANGTCRTR
jgi:hypothetical protein